MIAIGPEVWGPHLWKSMHFIALAYPNEPTDEQKTQYRNFYVNIHHLLPCSVCANNFKRHIIELPLTDDILKDKESLVKWTVDFHNLVNKETGKKTFQPNAIN